MLLPESWRENLLRVSVVVVVLSSAQMTLAAPRWSTSTVKKSRRSRSPEQARPAVQIWPMWLGWSVIWTLLKLEPVLRAWLFWPKMTFQTEGLGLELVQVASGTLGSQGLPLASTSAMLGLRPVLD